MRTKRPYNAPKLDEMLNRCIADKSDLPPSEMQVIKSVSVVGALFDKKYNMYDGDVQTIERALSVLNQAYIAVSQNVNFHFYNLLAPVKSDFLTAALIDDVAPQSDALILCGLFASKNPALIIENMSPLQRDLPYDNMREMYSDILVGMNYNREIAISRLQTDPCAWPQAADRIGAKIVITRGGSHDEIGSKHFLVDNFYRAAIPTEEKYETVHCAVSGSLGILINNQALPELKEQVNSGHIMGQRILSL